MSTLIPIPAGSIATVVTYLEMAPVAPPNPRSLDLPDFALHTVPHLTPTRYKALFRAVGADWLWYSRLRATDEEIAAILSHPLNTLFGLSVGCGAEEFCGLLELYRHPEDTVEICFLGVIPSMIGHGAGRFLLAQAIDIARCTSARRIWLQTCTLDHPNALDFYRAAGFRAYKRQIELAVDPRLDGTLPREAAPQVPIV